MIDLKKLRILRGLKQKELADKMGISAQQLNNYEGGQSNPGNKILPALADALGVSVAEADADGVAVAVGSASGTIDPNTGSHTWASLTTARLIRDAASLSTVGSMVIVLVPVPLPEPLELPEPPDEPLDPPELPEEVLDGCLAA